MSNFVTPSSSSEFTTDATPAEGSPLITNGAGTLNLHLEYQKLDLLDRVHGVPKFRTGELNLGCHPVLQIIESTLPLSAGQVTYKAVGYS